MARMTIRREDIERCIAEQRPLTVCEPACGSGSMVIAVAEAIKEMGFDPGQVMLATLIDLDPICMQMAFLQMALKDIPAICIHGDSLAGTEFERAVTLAALHQRWEPRAAAEAEVPDDDPEREDAVVVVESAPETEDTPSQVQPVRTELSE